MLRSLLAVVAVALSIAALLAPVVVFLASFWGFELDLASAFSRVALVAAAATALRLRRPLGLGRVFAAWRSEGGDVRRLLLGLGLGVLSAAAVLAALEGLGAVAWRATPGLGLVAGALATGLVVAAIEESGARVLLISALSRLGRTGAVVVAAAVFSLLHLFASPAPRWGAGGPGHGVPGSEISWQDGFGHLLRVVDALGEPALWPPLLGLFFVGFALGVVWVSTGSIRLCAGLHAGWILVLKLGSESARFLGDPALAQGELRRFFLIAQPAAWASVLFAAALAVVVDRQLRRGVTPAEKGAQDLEVSDPTLSKAVPSPGPLVRLLAVVALAFLLFAAIRVLGLDGGRAARRLAGHLAVAEARLDPRLWVERAFDSAARPRPEGWRRDFWLERLRLEGPRATAAGIRGAEEPDPRALLQPDDGVDPFLVRAVDATPARFVGWRPPEGEWRWAEDASASIRLDATPIDGESASLATLRGRTSRLDLRLGSLAPRRVDVLLGGPGGERLLGSVEVDGLGGPPSSILLDGLAWTLSAPVELSLLADGDPVRPAGDPRLLVLAFHSLLVRPLRFPSGPVFYDEDDYFWSGFSEAEGGSRWTVGPKASLVLPVREDQSGRLELEIRAWTRSRQRVEVFFDGASIGSAAAEAGEVALLFPLRGVVAGGHRVDLDLPDAAVRNGDPRPLGLAVRWIHLRRAGDARR